MLKFCGLFQKPQQLALLANKNSVSGKCGEKIHSEPSSFGSYNRSTLISFRYTDNLRIHRCLAALSAETSNINSPFGYFWETNKQLNRVTIFSNLSVQCTYMVDNLLKIRICGRIGISAMYLFVSTEFALAWFGN